MPSRASGYRFPPLPAPAKLDRQTWDAVLGDVDTRLDALEGKRTELQDLIDDLSFNGQARIDAAISPLIAQVEVDVADLREAVSAAVAAAANAATEVTAEVRSRVATLEGKVASVEAEFNRILASGLAAGMVSLAAIVGFAPTTVQAAIETIVAAGLNTIYRVARSSNSQLTAADKAKLVDCTGTFTQTFASFAALGDGWWIILRNNGTGIISASLDGATTQLQPGDVRLVQNDGSARRSILIVDGQLEARARRFAAAYAIAFGGF